MDDARTGSDARSLGPRATTAALVALGLAAIAAAIGVVTFKAFELDRAAIEQRNEKNKADAQKVADKIDGQTYVMIRQAGETGHLYGSVAGRDVAEAIQAEGGKVERSQVVLNTAIKSLGVHEVPVRLHAEVRATVKINIARSMDEAERQAKGEDVIRSQFDDERQAAEQSAQELIEGGAGQQEGFGDEA